MGSGIPYDYYKAINGSGTVSKTATVNGRTINASKIGKSTSTPSVISVYDSFDWSTTPYGNAGFDKNLIPRAFLGEYRMKNDSILQALLYFGTVTAQGGNLTVGTAADKAAAAIAEAAPDLKLAGIDVVNMMASVKKRFSGLVAPAANFLSPTDSTNLTKNAWMKPYEGLYSLESTPFQYVLPYFDNKGIQDVMAGYSDISYPTMIGDVLANAANVAQGAANVARIVAPGQYVERPKIFDMTSSGYPMVTITFPLLNTQSYESAVQNYQLLWLLVFQNTPQRVSKTLVDLPKIYEVNVPGVSHLKFSFMEEMHVEFIGARRQVDIQMPDNSVDLNTTAQIIMPDAYQVKMVFRSLTINSANLMLENWYKSSSKKATAA